MFKQKICFEIWGGEAGKYKLKDNDGNDVDVTPEDTCKRVAKALASVEKNPGYWYKEFSNIIGNRFAGGGRIMANAGSKEYKKQVSLINCCVASQIPDSLDGIMDVAKEAALVLKAGCGIGYDFSTLRPKHAHVFGAGAGTSGVISFMKVFDTICSTILSGGGRRGSQMGVLDTQHPDIEEFITAKRQDGVLRYFNVSALMTEKFMNAVVNDETWSLWFWEKNRNKDLVVNKDEIKLIKKNDIPYNHSDYNYFSFDKNHTEVVYNNATESDIFVKKVYRTLKAKSLYDIIIKSTYEFNDPGVIFIDRVNSENNLWFIEVIRTSNPCVTGDTKLHTNHGMVTVKDLFENKNEIKCTVDNRTLDNGDGVSVRDAIPVFKTADSAKVYKVITKAGYEIKATEWHDFYTQRGKIKLKDLQIGDSLFIQSGEGQWGNLGSRELGLVYGLIVGDGHFSKNKKENSCRAVLSLWGKDKVLKDLFSSCVSKIIKDTTHNGYKNRKYTNTFTEVKTRDNFSLGSEILAKELINNGIDIDNKYEIPEFIWKGSRECVVGFLQGLFQSDGFICASKISKTCDVRLSSVELNLLKQVQEILSNFGIFCSIYSRRKAGNKLLPDGNGGQRNFFCKENYELIIGSQSRNKFIKEIGFLVDYKYNKYNEFKSVLKNNGHKQKFETKITSIEFVGEEPVYDTTQPDHNSVIFNGLVTGQCSEQFLPPNSNCLLGSMLLCDYVKNVFEENAEFDWDLYKKDIRTASRALDNVVEQHNLPLQSLADSLEFQRRHGMGFTGLGSSLNMLGIKYGSKESIDFAEKLTLVLAQESLLAGIEIAKEKGSAPALASLENRKLFLDGNYMKRLISSFENPDEIKNLILEHGVRWSHATSLAPTGTMSLSWGNNCSNGIEPVFADSYMRNVRKAGKKTKVQEEVLDYAFFLWKEKYGDKQLPKHWSTTATLKIEDHVAIQAVIQKWCDSAISKTINVPTDYPFDDFKNIYINAWKLGLKGTTSYRYNPEITSGVLLQKEDGDKTQYVFTTEDGKEVTVNGNDVITYDGEDHVASNLFDALKEGLYGNM